MGYHRAGFRVIGIDSEPQKHYPFEFHQMDWAEGLIRFGGYVDAIHASPPCQAYSEGTAHLRASGKVYPDLLPPIRAALQSQPRPWVIENVPGAPMRPDWVLCGSLFDLPGLIRHRWFETSWQPFEMMQPCRHDFAVVTVVGHGPNSHSPFRRRGGWVKICREAMGIDWMTGRELSEAIPPAYTEFIGARLMDQVAMNSPAL